MKLNDGAVDTVDVISEYRYPAAFDGGGQRIALVEIGGNFRFDELQIYCSAMGIPTPVVHDVGVDGSRDDGDPLPAALDVQVTASAAPGAELVVYRTAGTDATIVDAISDAIGSPDMRATVIAIPWAIPEADAGLFRALEGSFRHAALTGITVCAAADPVAHGGRFFPPYPASSQYVLACGPTTLERTTADEYKEVAVARPREWYEALESRVFEAGSWQRDRSSAEVANRLLPDVVALADETVPYRTFIGDRWQMVSSPGVAACLWAGLSARMAQALGHPLGCWTPNLYASAGPAGALRAVGNGSPPGSPSVWQPGVGWGSPDGERLLAHWRSA